jgi:hypothetical protein
MKPARPWMLAHLKIIWQFHQKVSRFFGPRYIGDDLFLGPNLVSFNRSFIRVIVPYENIYYVPLTHKCILGNLHVLPFSYSPVNTRVGSPIKHYLFIPSIGLSICYMVLVAIIKWEKRIIYPHQVCGEEWNWNSEEGL